MPGVECWILRPQKIAFAPAISCFCARKKFTNLRPQKFAFQPQKICDHKIFAFRRKSFCTRKYLIHFCAQNGLRSLLQKSGNCAQKKFLHANYAICAQAKIPENGNPNRMYSIAHIGIFPQEENIWYVNSKLCVYLMDGPG